MATEIKTWEIIRGELIEVNTRLVQNDRKEKDVLEKWFAGVKRYRCGNNG